MVYCIYYYYHKLVKERADRCLLRQTAFRIGEPRILPELARPSTPHKGAFCYFFLYSKEKASDSENPRPSWLFTEPRRRNRRQLGRHRPHHLADRRANQSHLPHLQ